MHFTKPYLWFTNQVYKTRKSRIMSGCQFIDHGYNWLSFHMSWALFPSNRTSCTTPLPRCVRVMRAAILGLKSIQFLRKCKIHEGALPACSRTSWTQSSACYKFLLLKSMQYKHFRNRHSTYPFTHAYNFIWLNSEFIHETKFYLVHIKVPLK